MRSKDHPPSAFTASEYQSSSYTTLSITVPLYTSVRLSPELLNAENELAEAVSPKVCNAEVPASLEIIT